MGKWSNLINIFQIGRNHQLDQKLLNLKPFMEEVFDSPSGMLWKKNTGNSNE